LNILIVPDRLDTRGGLETHVTSLAKEWCIKSMKNNVLIYANAISTKFKKELLGCSLISGWSDKSTNYVINEFKPDIIIAHPFSGLDLGFKISEKVDGSKLFSVMHGDYSTGLTEKIINKSEKVICVSKTAYNAVKNIVPLDKLSIIYNGINTKQFYPTQPSKLIIKKLNLKQNRKTIVIVSRLQDAKEIPIKQLLQISPDLAKKVKGLNIIIIGGGTALDEIKSIAKEKNDYLNLEVKVLGEQSNIRSYLNLADVVLGCDRVALEAILCKKNVFYMGLPKWKGLIKFHNFKELLFSKEGFVDYTDGELTSHMLWMLLHQEDIKPFTEGLYENIKELCDIKKVAKSYLNLFNSN
jgi:glycosyltransferase involved in cell wall biosynthesis